MVKLSEMIISLCLFITSHFSFDHIDQLRYRQSKTRRSTKELEQRKHSSAEMQEVTLLQLLIKIAICQTTYS